MLPPSFATVLDRHRWPLVAVAGVGLAVWVFVWAVAPSYGRLYAVYRGWQQNRVVIGTLETQPEALPATADEAERLRRQWAMLSARLPPSNQTSVVVAFLRTRADSAGVRLTQIEPRPVEEGRGEIRVRVRLGGRFHAVGAFVEALERGPLPVRIDAVDLSVVSGSGSRLDGALYLRVATAESAPPTPRQP